MKNVLFYLLALTLVFATSCSGGKNKSEGSTETATADVKSTEKSDVKVGINIGNRAPELAYPSPDGEVYKLSDLRGKMVLIDFWAAWCPPCRMENPNLVRTYDEFKDAEFKNGDGFTIYSVSLDATKENWIKGIQEDNLKWKYHVSDLKYWESVPAAMYQVRGIPASYLINGDGIIVAKNLRGPALPAELERLRQ